MNIDPALADIAANVRGVVFDVDGVLTDGRIIYTDDGRELKQFHVQDGASLKLLQQHDVAIGIITGRRSPMVARRARELGIRHVRQGVTSKPEAFAELVAEGFPADGNCMVGDDLPDLELFEHPGFALAATVPNAHPAVLARAHFVTSRSGGEGAAVDIAQLILTAQNRWPY